MAFLQSRSFVVVYEVVNTALNTTPSEGKTKVHQFANKKFKSLLSNCATSAINCNPEMRNYYNKRISLGKNKMSTLNIIRNKLLSRIFAVVKRGTPYVDTMGYAA